MGIRGIQIIALCVSKIGYHNDYRKLIALKSEQKSAITAFIYFVRSMLTPELFSKGSITISETSCELMKSRR
jgi:hypothetical protein